METDSMVEIEKHQRKILNAQMAPQTLARMFGVIQTFIAQLGIFYAQWSWMSVYQSFLDKKLVGRGEEGETGQEWSQEIILGYLNGPATIWLRMETCAYYCIIISAISYIVFFSVRSSFKNWIISDLNKQTNDFI